MRISAVTITNYRSHRSTTVDLDDYTAFIGANGAGKSSLFYALRWFFDGTSISERDVCDSREAESAVSVSVAFTELTGADRARLGEYARGETANFTRSWSGKEDDKSKVFGNAIAGPGFPEVRAESRVTFKRPAYVGLRSNVDGLPDFGKTPSAADIDQALADWESDIANQASMVVVKDSDANHLFGINGKNVIRDCIRMILVPAATDITADVGESGRGSTLSDLIGAVVTSASAKARAEWQLRYADELAELNLSITSGVNTATISQANRVNARLKNLIPNASVEFTAIVPEWTPKGDPSVSTVVRLGEAVGDLANHGHGTQRAVMIAMFQSLAPDRDSTLAQNAQGDDESEEDHRARIDAVVENLPALLICIEEPEIYQHPVRARGFARVLDELSAQSNVQVAVATHSPYFVRPTQFHQLRRFNLADGVTDISWTTIDAAATRAGVNSKNFTLTIERHLPTVFSEGFFSDAVVLVEGDTDKVCIEGIADGRGFSLDLAGVSILPLTGKNELRMAYAILRSLKVPVYVVFDGDADSADRKYPGGGKSHADAAQSNQDQTAAALEWLEGPSEPTEGEPRYVFGGPTLVAERFTVWRDDLETELAAWPSFLVALKDAGGTLRQKKAQRYRAATHAASHDDVPDNLRLLVDAVRAFQAA
ncbi:ATP-dependent endonuclease [Cryobacterium sp. TMB1-7]|uniref:ATP-dependent nuclease n=1 Tax=Cryobacterium sp. TMB1-7 TaxID=2555866 RepID=UPI00106D00BB|nr:AAA family ATPase [Cryobacterium sp. TMB1-7]TFC61747.1 ATP-dependent endonuclease [Cryobacterium sp. TMB1-7]